MVHYVVCFCLLFVLKFLSLSLHVTALKLTCVCVCACLSVVHGREIPIVDLFATASQLNSLWYNNWLL